MRGYLASARSLTAAVADLVDVAVRRLAQSKRSSAQTPIFRAGRQTDPTQAAVPPPAMA